MSLLSLTTEYVKVLSGGVVINGPYYSHVA